MFYENQLLPESLLQRFEEIAKAPQTPLSDLTVVAKYRAPRAGLVWYVTMYDPNLNMFLWFEEKDNQMEFSIFMIGTLIYDHEPRIIASREWMLFCGYVERDTSFTERTLGSFDKPITDKENMYKMFLEVSKSYASGNNGTSGLIELGKTTNN